MGCHLTEQMRVRNASNEGLLKLTMRGASGLEERIIPPIHPWNTCNAPLIHP